MDILGYERVDLSGDPSVRKDRRGYLRGHATARRQHPQLVGAARRGELLPPRQGLPSTS
jgi:hypothetical protein